MPRGSSTDPPPRAATASTARWMAAVESLGTGGVCAVVDGVDAHGRIGHEGLNPFDGYRVRC